MIIQFKKITILALVGIILFSCDGKNEICDCSDTMVSMYEEIKKSDDSKSIVKKYQEKLDACDKSLGSPDSPETLEKLKKEQNCPSAKTLIQILEEENKNAELCDCASTIVAMTNDMQLSGDGQAVLEDYKEKLEKCDKILGSPDSPQTLKKLEKIAKKCPYAAELMQLIEEQQ
jgi:hypothetical protein